MSECASLTQAWLCQEPMPQHHKKLAKPPHLQVRLKGMARPSLALDKNADSVFKI